MGAQPHRFGKNRLAVRGVLGVVGIGTKRAGAFRSFRTGAFRSLGLLGLR
jgi:hypothetical protein